ncbi:MAG: archaemetzincin family Zn-dependent metalloprotease [Candidatus Omnitrophica bacterium]|nr:archaemetzincin family Zn-dependent metalloprotease [Candidatus Omnitrophota bacterium]
MEIKIISFGQIDDFILDYLKENLERIFKVPVFFGKGQAIPEYAYNKKRRQYLSSLILDGLCKIKQKDEKILSLINQDLYVPKLNFVFGEADPVGGVCIISLTRLFPSYYGLKEDKDLLLKRTLKESVHEFGHLLGLKHCANIKCVMHFSNSILDTDIKDDDFCNECKRLLRLDK